MVWFFETPVHVRKDRQKSEKTDPEKWPLTCLNSYTERSHTQGLVIQVNLRAHWFLKVYHCPAGRIVLYIKDVGGSFGRSRMQPKTGKDVPIQKTAEGWIETSTSPCTCAITALSERLVVMRWCQPFNVSDKPLLLAVTTGAWRIYAPFLCRSPP